MWCATHWPSKICKKGANFEAQMEPKSIPKAIMFGITFWINFGDAFLEDLGSILAPILEVFRYPYRIKNEKATYMKNGTAP